MAEKLAIPTNLQELSTVYESISQLPEKYHYIFYRNVRDVAAEGIGLMNQLGFKNPADTLAIANIVDSQHHHIDLNCNTVVCLTGAALLGDKTAQEEAPKFNNEISQVIKHAYSHSQSFAPIYSSSFDRALWDILPELLLRFNGPQKVVEYLKNQNLIPEENYGKMPEDLSLTIARRLIKENPQDYYDFIHHYRVKYSFEFNNQARISLALVEWERELIDGHTIMINDIKNKLEDDYQYLDDQWARLKYLRRGFRVDDLTPISNIEEGMASREASIRGALVDFVTTVAKETTSLSSLKTLELIVDKFIGKDYLDFVDIPSSKIISLLSIEKAYLRLGEKEKAADISKKIIGLVGHPEVFLDKKLTINNGNFLIAILKAVLEAQALSGNIEELSTTIKNLQESNFTRNQTYIANNIIAYGLSLLVAEKNEEEQTSLIAQAVKAHGKAFPPDDNFFSRQWEMGISEKAIFDHQANIKPSEIITLIVNQLTHDLQTDKQGSLDQHLTQFSYLLETRRCEDKIKIIKGVLDALEKTFGLEKLVLCYSSLSLPFQQAVSESLDKVSKQETRFLKEWLLNYSHLLPSYFLRLSFFNESVARKFWTDIKLRLDQLIPYKLEEIKTAITLDTPELAEQLDVLMEIRQLYYPSFCLAGDTAICTGILMK